MYDFLKVVKLGALGIGDWGLGIGDRKSVV